MEVLTGRAPRLGRPPELCNCSEFVASLCAPPSRVRAAAAVCVETWVALASSASANAFARVSPLAATHHPLVNRRKYSMPDRERSRDLSRHNPEPKP